MSRSLVELRTSLALRQGQIRTCFRAARYLRPAASETVRLRGEIAPLGELRVTDVMVERSGDATLAACIRDSLSSLSVPTVTPRQTVFDVKLLLYPSKFPAPKMPLPSPSVTPIVRSAACLPVEEPLSVDRLVSEQPLLALDDADTTSLRHECQEGDRRGWERYGQCLRDAKAQRRRNPSRSFTCLRDHEHLYCCMAPYRETPIEPLDPVRLGEYVKEALGQNLGAYRNCYAEATTRHADSRVHLLVHGQIDRAGMIRATVGESELGDGALRECVSQAVSGVWIHPWPQPLDHDEIVEFDYPLKLQPARSSVEGFAELSHHRSAHPRPCLGRIEELRALLTAGPWLRFEKAGELAMQPLVSALRSEPRDSPCFRQAAELLTHLATQPHKFGTSLQLPVLLDRAMVRYPLLGSLAPVGTPAPLLRFWNAQGLFKLGRYCEAAPIYEETWSGLDPERQQTAAYGAWLSWKECLEPEWRDVPGENAPHPLDPRLIHASQTLLQLAPQSAGRELAHDIAMTLIQSLINHGQCAVAAEEAIRLQQHLPFDENEQRELVDSARSLMRRCEK